MGSPIGRISGMPKSRNALIPTANFSRMPPSRPRASPRSCASMFGLRVVRRRASTATAGLPPRVELESRPRLRKRAHADVPGRVLTSRRALSAFG